MENPFASPSGDPAPSAPPVAADWERPAYQRDERAYVPPRVPETRRTLIPRNLVAACHTSAVAAEVFVVCVWSFLTLFDRNPLLGILTYLAAGAVMATILLVSLGVAVGALLAAVPLGVAWWRGRGERAGGSHGERAALLHLGIAWTFAGYYLARYFL